MMEDIGGEKCSPEGDVGAWQGTQRYEKEVIIY